MKRWILPIAVVFMLSACEKNIQGKLYSLSDGNVMDFQIERSHGTGGMFAQNTKTGENFSGQYTATINARSDNATAHGVLMGEKGTVIDLSMDIQPGINPTGHGEGRDNKGNRYQVQF